MFQMFFNRDLILPDRMVLNTNFTEVHLGLSFFLLIFLCAYYVVEKFKSSRNLGIFLFFLFVFMFS